MLLHGLAVIKIMCDYMIKSAEPSCSCSVVLEKGWLQPSVCVAERNKLLGSLETVQMGTSKDDVRRIVEPKLKDIMRKVHYLPRPAGLC